MRAVLFCRQCGTDSGHDYHPARGWLCDGCGLAQPPDDLTRVAEERTSAIAPVSVAMPVTKEIDRDE